MLKNSQKLLQKIEERHIKQVPRLYFVLKNYLFISIFIFATIFGAVAFSVILYIFSVGDFDLLFNSSLTKLQLVLTTLPFVWVIMVALFIVVSFFGMRHTKKGYRHPIYKILILNILIGVFLGSLFFYVGGSKKVEDFFAVNIPFYTGMEEKKIKLWSSPENGLLSGEILLIEKDLITVKTFDDLMWVVDIRNTLTRKKVSLEKGELIKIVGSIIKENTFLAEEIRPWIGRGRGRMHNSDTRIKNHRY